MRVADIAHGRSGDKGDICNVGLVACDDAGYDRSCCARSPPSGSPSTSATW